jgi:hypothetical protein
MMRVASDDTNSRSWETKTRVPVKIVEAGVEGLDGFHVQVVGRLVHQQHVGAQQHQLAEQHAALLAAGDHLDRLLHLVAGEQQAAQGAADQGFGVVAVVAAGTHPFADPVGEVLPGRNRRRGPGRSSRAWPSPPT